MLEMSWLLMFSGAIAFTGQSVSASCPLELSTPAVVVRYGDTASVNCTTSSTQVKGMGWETPYGGIPFIRGVTFLFWTATLKDEWTIKPLCYMTDNSSRQCAKELSVTLYKMPDNVSISQSNHTGPMVEGRVYQLQCDVTDIAPVRNLSVTWYKGNEIIHTESYDNAIATPRNESSTLTFTPDRHDNGAQVFCKTQLNLGSFGPNPSPMMSSMPHDLIVYYPPTLLSPEPETLDLAMGDKIILNCSATGNPEPVYSWRSSHQMQDETENRAVVSPSTPRPGTYNCTTSNVVGTQIKQFIIIDTPSSHPGTTAGIIIAVLILLGLAGGLVFYYKHRNSPVASPQQSVQMSTVKLEFLSPDSQSTIQREKTMGNSLLKWIITLCMFYFVSGEGCSLVLKPSRVVVGFGEPVSVNCEAARPVRVLGWESAIGAAHTQQDLSVQWKVDSLIDWIEEPICYGVFFTAPRQCEEKLNIVLYKTPDSVSISPVNHTGPMVEGKEYQLLCEVQNIAPVQYLTLRWYRGQTEVYNHSFSELTPSSPVQVSSILMITPTKADNGAQYRCVAELDLGPEGPQPPPSVTSEPLNASVYYPPSFLSPEAEMLDLVEGAEIILNCSAIGNPIPVYSWQSSHPMQEKLEDQAVFTSSSLLPGTYTCTASNRIDKKSKQFIVKATSNGRRSL
ncbi:vascular cell adhesion protein 1-like [Polymixia lowei]